jgi:hypothetical protein
LIALLLVFSSGCISTYTGGYSYRGVQVFPSDDPIHLKLNTTDLLHIGNFTDTTFYLGIVHDDTIESNWILNWKNWTNDSNETGIVTFESKAWSGPSFYKYPSGSARNLSFHISVLSNDMYIKNRKWFGASNTVNCTINVTLNGRTQSAYSSVDLVGSNPGIKVGQGPTSQEEKIIINNGQWDFSLYVLPIGKWT